MLSLPAADIPISLLGGEDSDFFFLIGNKKLYERNKYNSA